MKTVRGRWTADELARLRLIYPIVSAGALANEFRRHSSGAIASMAFNMGLRRRRSWMDIVKKHRPVIFSAPREAQQ